MALLDIVRDAAAQIGIPEPVSAVGNPAVDARRLVRFATMVGRSLATRAPWQALRAAHAFAAVAAEEQPGAVPAGFLHFSAEAMWDATNQESITGPIGPAEYQSRKNDHAAEYSPSSLRWFTRRGNALLVYPPPAGDETYIFEYQSANFCQSAGGTPQASWLADTDAGLLSEELITLGVIYSFLDADGQPATAARQAFERRLVNEIGNDAPGARVLAAGDIFGTGRRFTGEPGAGRGRSGFTADIWGGGGGGVWE